MATRAGQSTSARADHHDPHAWLGGDGLAADARNGPAKAGRRRTDPADSSETETRAQRLVRAPYRTTGARVPAATATAAPPPPPRRRQSATPQPPPCRNRTRLLRNPGGCRRSRAREISSADTRAWRPPYRKAQGWAGVAWETPTEPSSRGLIPRNYHISDSFLSGRKFAAIGRLIRRRQWITVTVVTVINQELH